MFYIFNRLDNFLVSNRAEKKLTNVEDAHDLIICQYIGCELVFPLFFRLYQR